MRMTLIVLACVSLVAAVGLSGQAQRQPATLDDVVAEIRALRADLGKTSNTTARMQLLTARLAAQEQRIGILSSQRANVTPKLIDAARQRAEADAQLQRFQETQAKNLPEELPREQRDALLDTFKRSAGRFRDLEQQLRAEDDRLAAEIAAEQNRWLDFNGRLDALERELK